MDIPLIQMDLLKANLVKFGIRISCKNINIHLMIKEKKEDFLERSDIQ